MSDTRIAARMDLTRRELIVINAGLNLAIDDLEHPGGDAPKPELLRLAYNLRERIRAAFNATAPSDHT